MEKGARLCHPARQTDLIQARVLGAPAASSHASASAPLLARLRQLKSRWITLITAPLQAAAASSPIPSNAKPTSACAKVRPRSEQKIAPRMAAATYVSQGRPTIQDV